MLTCQRPFKTLVFSFLSLISFFSLTSCGGDREIEASQVAVAQIKPAESTKENDKQFLVRAVEMRYEQILLGKLAQRRSTTQEIIDLAKLLEEYNRETKSSLASLGIIKSIPVPSVPPPSAQAAYDKLNEASVEEFDVTYVRYALQGYNDAMAHFENASRGNLDPDIKSKASSMIPDMRTHLTKAMELDARLNPMSEAVR